MLTENTGRSLCDSGGAYGRHWEQNQRRDFEAEPPTTLSFRGGIEVEHNVYHWLLSRLCYHETWDLRFKQWMHRREEGWLELMAEWPRQQAKRMYSQARGPGWNTDAPLTMNTYNHESLVSQVLQYVYYEIDDASFVLLQIHGGCDVRGGYTRPRVFTVEHEGALFDDTYGTIFVDASDPAWKRYERLRQHPVLFGTVPSVYPTHWRTDDGYHWYPDYGMRGEALEEYDRTDDPEQRGQGVLYVDADDNGYCPISGALLRACW
jgi:hypothetical protein